MTVIRKFKLPTLEIPPEGKVDLLSTLDAGYLCEAGGDIFTVKIGSDCFRYDYQGEWIEFEPLGRVLPGPAASIAQDQLSYFSFWKDTDLKFTVGPYGVKVDIILMSDQAPTDFSFRTTKSLGWKDDLIQPPYLKGYLKDGSPILLGTMVNTEKVDDIVTYKLTLKEREQFLYPLTIDPTFNIAAGIDDTRGFIGSTGGDQNQYTLVVTDFGKYSNAGKNFDIYNWQRFSLDIPRASRVIAANLSFTALYTQNGAFNTYIARLNPALAYAWTGAGGFNTTNYANCTALLAISQDATQITYTPAAWTAESPYDSPDITTLLQEQLDDLVNYDPLVTASSYIGLYIDNGDGTYIALGTTSDVRRAYGYEGDPAKAGELDITFDPWAEIRTANGMKYDSVLGAYRYFDY